VQRSDEHYRSSDPASAAPTGERVKPHNTDGGTHEGRVADGHAQVETSRMTGKVAI
jgi:hypothetical protein